jgi:hypothetical protein
LSSDTYIIDVVALEDVALAVWPLGVWSPVVWRLDVWRLDVWRLDVWRLDVWARAPATNAMVRAAAIFMINISACSGLKPGSAMRAQNLFNSPWGKTN